MCRFLLMLLSLMLAMPANGQTNPNSGQNESESDGTGLDLVPLVDMKAPLVAIWFVADPNVSMDDASALESQVYDEFFKRTKIRVLSREKMIDELQMAKADKLQGCRGEDICLYKIGRALDVKQIVGIQMNGDAKNYRVVLKSFDLEKDKPTQLNSVVEGSLAELLIGGIGSGVAAIFDNTDQYAPLELKAPATENKTPASSAKVVAKQVEKTAPVSRPMTETVQQKPEPAPIAVRTVEQKPSAAENLVAEVPRRPGFLRRHLWSAIALGASIATLGTGIALGAMGQKIADDQSVRFDPDSDSSGRTYTTTANAMFGISGAAALTSILLFFFLETDDSGPGLVTIVPGPSGGMGALVKF